MPSRQSAAALTVALVLFSAAAGAADAQAGKAKAQVCAACHGQDGSPSDPAIPSLAGQPAQSIATQLYQFREGNRKSDQMSPMAAKLSNEDMNDVAAYFASLKPVAPKKRASAENAALGPPLTQKFHCTQCHGPALLGQQHIPRIAGQQPEYLRAQLKGFRAGTRADMDGNMTSAARELSDKDVDVLVDYIAGIGAP